MITSGQREELAAYAELVASYKDLLRTQQGFLATQQGIIKNLLDIIAYQEKPQYSLSPRAAAKPVALAEHEADVQALREIAPHLNPEDQAALEDYLAESGFMNSRVEEVPSF